MRRSAENLSSSSRISTSTKPPLWSRSLDRTGRLRRRGLAERGRRGERAARGADMEIPSRHSPPAGLSRGCAFGLRTLVRGFRLERRVMRQAPPAGDFANRGPTRRERTWAPVLGLACNRPGKRPFLCFAAASASCPSNSRQLRSIARSRRGCGRGFSPAWSCSGRSAVTAYIAWWAIDTVDNWVKPWLPHSLSPDAYLPFHLPGFGVVIALVGLTLLGFLAANIIGRSLVRLQRGDA